MNFTNQLKQLDDAYRIVGLAEERVAKRFVIEVKKMLAKLRFVVQIAVCRMKISERLDDLVVANVM